MRRHLRGLAHAFSIVLMGLSLGFGCNPTTTTTDLAVVPPGCRLPSKCWSPSSCDCTRGSVVGASPGSCLVCDPALTDPSIQQCDCSGDLGLVCLEPARLCVGRGPVCTGTGARCIAHGVDLGVAGCTGASGDPPMMVPIPTDGGLPESEPRCAYVDDVCCPGVLDMSVPDLEMVD
jgi:hypothetical protein